MREKVLLTDGTHKNALAVLRSISSTKDVDVTSRLPRYRSMCGLSKFVRKMISIESHCDAEEYGTRLLEILSESSYDHFLPVGLDSYIASSMLKKEIVASSRCLLPDWKDMEIAYNKDRTMALADRIGVPTPLTTEIAEAKDLEEIRLPVVLKSSEPGSVRYCGDRTALRKCFADISSGSSSAVIAQEIVDGYGCGFYGVYKDGQLMDFFLHRRVKEFPITGGASAVAESYRSERLFDLGKALGDALNWTGPIMAEFKFDASAGDYKLMEVNPKLWGSLDLTMAAGVNIPELIFGLADGSITRPVASRYEEAHYKDVRFRWPFPDQFKVFCSRPGSAEAKDLLFGKGMTNISIDDPLPNLFLTATGIVEGLKIMVDEKARYPHGRRADVQG